MNKPNQMTLWFSVEDDFGGRQLAHEEQGDENQFVLFEHVGHVFPRIFQNVGLLQINFALLVMKVWSVQMPFRHSLDLSPRNRPLYLRLECDWSEIG